MDTTELRIFFERCYPLLTDNTTPYYWQRELFLRFCAGEFPAQIDLPTGTGKTSLMDIWFLALTRQALGGKLTIPRRLVWVVNRRVVVDQATDRAIDIAKNCSKLPSDCTKALSSLSITGCEAPAISTLRGEKADNREWTKDPSRPAIVIGTVDMIGSRLLFSGYRDGDYYRPQHAGLLGVDTLVVNDEAHLTPAFIYLLGGISQRDPARHIAGKTFVYLSLSATPSHSEPQDRFPRSLENDMIENATFRTRVTGYKRLSLHSVADNKHFESMILELAIHVGAPRTIVYVEQPEKALEMFKKIDKLHRGRVELLTGTMRGYERDRLLNTAVFKAMISEDPPLDPVWLVATSAGEVGIDITSERQISTLVSADHLIQRFGRLNRFGTGHGEAHVVYTPPKDKETVLLKTLEYLQSLEELDGGRDIHCLALRERPPAADAQTEVPVLAELHDWLLELWCQTSDPVKGYPPVESWLHGQKEDEGPETEFAWREEIPYLTSEDISDEQRRLALRYHRVLAREKLREPTKRLTEKLKLLADIHPAATRVLVQRKDRSTEVCSLREAVDGEPLDYSLVLLPPRMGALIHGMFSAALPNEAEYANDVADEVSADDDRRRERWRGARSDRGSYTFTRLTADLVEQEVVEDLTSSLKSFADGRGMRVMLQMRIPISEEEETPDRVLIFLRERPEHKSTKPVLLAAHSDDVSYYAGALADTLIPSLGQLYRDAGRLHDTGKASDLWQRVMGNGDPSITVAKPVRVTKGGSGLGGYRHELGSLVDARRLDSISTTEDTKDLLLHLIASHHGHSRPHFPKDAHDTRALRESDDAMVESVDRFGHLINDWGPWGLAYLEAIFKAADGIASSKAEESSAAEEQPDDEQD
jgi:CRISPR-associated endonuclease/helicase Cas3